MKDSIKKKKECVNIYTLSYIYIDIDAAGSLCCTVEIEGTLQINYSLIRIFKKNFKNKVSTKK